MLCQLLGQHWSATRAHSASLGHADKLQNFSNRSTTSADETACTQQPCLRPGCHLHTVSSSYVVVMHCIGMDGPLTSWLHTPSDPCIVRVCSVVVVAPAAAHVSPRLAHVGPRCEVCLRYFTKSLRATVFMQTVYSTVVRGYS